jgi:hypothetical protein
MKYMKPLLAAAISIFIVAVFILFTFFLREWQPNNAKTEKRQLARSSVSSPNPKPNAGVSASSPEKRQSLGDPESVDPPSPPPPLGAGKSAQPPAGTNSTRTYVLHVVDSSNAPILNASVYIESGDSPLARGKTNPGGIFAFVGQLSSRYTQVHVSVHAAGYVPLDEYSPLIEERIIHLSKAN